MADEWDEKAREFDVCNGLKHPHDRNKALAVALREAYRRGRNEADTAAERRGIERAAKVCRSFVADEVLSAGAVACEQAILALAPATGKESG